MTNYDLLNGISTYVGYLIPSFEKNSSGTI